jgi:hypothetical protein
VVPPVVRRGVWGLRGVTAAARAAVLRVALVSGWPLGVRGNPGNAMRRPVQKAGEPVVVGHLHLVSLSVIEKL